MSLLLFVLIVYVVIKSQEIPDQVKREKYQVIIDRWTADGEHYHSRLRRKTNVPSEVRWKGHSGRN